MIPLPCVPTGVANTASLAAAFARLGCQLVEADAAAVASAGRLVLPGVGQFGAAMAELGARGLRAPLQQRLRAGRATLGICLGMQLCCDASEEDPAVPGLGAVPGRVARFPAGTRCPQMGWNAVEAPPGAGLLRSGHAYFANSYRLAAPPPGWRCAAAAHGGPFVAALERDGVLLCQFHPELSGAFGEQLLQRWLAATAEAAC